MDISAISSLASFSNTSVRALYSAFGSTDTTASAGNVGADVAGILLNSLNGGVFGSGRSESGNGLGDYLTSSLGTTLDFSQTSALSNSLDADTFQALLFSTGYNQTSTLLSGLTGQSGVSSYQATLGLLAEQYIVDTSSLNFNVTA